MNRAYIEGYVNLGQYDGTRETSTGKKVTKFTIASGKKDAKEYYSMALWHDEHHDERSIIEGGYAHVECTPKAWSHDGKRGVEFSVWNIWYSPRSLEKPAEEAVYADDDLPF